MGPAFFLSSWTLLPSIQKIIRVGNDTIEVLLDDFENELIKITEYMIQNGIKINSMSKDTASFGRYFQIRIQEEEQKERRKKDISQNGGEAWWIDKISVD